MGNIFGFYKTRHILLSDSANCTVLRAVVLTQYRRVTDGQTDGIAVASTAPAKRRAVKSKRLCLEFADKKRVRNKEGGEGAYDKPLRLPPYSQPFSSPSSPPNNGYGAWGSAIAPPTGPGGGRPTNAFLCNSQPKICKSVKVLPTCTKRPCNISITFPKCRFYPCCKVV